MSNYSANSRNTGLAKRQAEVAAKPKFSQVISSAAIQTLINNTLGDKNRASRFVASISSAVATTPALQECTPNSVINAALLGDSLNLSPSTQLGQFYIVPFNSTVNGISTKIGQFIIGYKGYIQLAIRSGYYKKMNVIAIKQGEFIQYNRITEELEANFIEDDEIRENTPTTGYYAYFEYVNGFTKSLYWSKAKMEHHAITYSKGYAAKKGYTYWEKDFDGMAFKTMLRQLISKWGVMSIEMQKAFEYDQSVIDNEGNNLKANYVDNPEFDDFITPVEVAEEISNPTKEETKVSKSTKKQESIFAEYINNDDNGDIDFDPEKDFGR